MKQIRKIARGVAAIDENLLDECPASDKIWANHIGYTLSLTFVVLFGIVFYSMTYIDGAHVIFDAQSNSIKLDSHPFSYLDYLRYALIALIIALIIFLFDRAFYQSDWFLHATYGTESTILEKSKSIISKFLRISVRLVISLALAYALSIFLELKFYESELLTAMQKKHHQENIEHYDALKTYAKTLDAEESELKQEEARLVKQIQNMNNGIFSWSDDAIFQQLIKSHRILQSGLENNISSLNHRREQKLKNLEQEQDFLEDTLENHENKYNQFVFIHDEELDGNKVKINIEGETFETSGHEGNGTNTKLFSLKINEIHRKVKSIKKDLNKVNNKIKTINNEFDNDIATLKQSVLDDLSEFKKEKNDYKSKKKKNLDENKETIKRRLEATLDRIQIRLKYLQNNKNYDIKQHYQEVMQSPEFIPFRDGMMSRLITFKELSKDPIYGEEITFFSWIVKGFLIFLEIIPVISKMLFGPPTVYATKLQMRTKRITENLIINQGETLQDMQEQIDIEDKKRELIEARWQTRLKASFHHISDDDLNDMMKLSIDAHTSKNVA